MMAKLLKLKLFICLLSLMERMGCESASKKQLRKVRCEALPACVGTGGDRWNRPED